MNIQGFENYSINQSGEIYNIKSGHKRALTINKTTGYLQITFYNKNKPKTFQVHRLVALAFIDNHGNLPQVNHKDGNKLNNCVDNLEWVSDSENKLHCYKTGLKDKNILSIPIVMTYPNTLLPISEFVSANEAGRVLNVNQGNITNCCKHKCKTVYGYSWYYKDEFDCLKGK